MNQQDPDWWRQWQVDLPVGQHGRWAIERFTVLPGERIQPYYSVYGRDVPPGNYTRLVRYLDDTPEIWETLGSVPSVAGISVMTDTPGEIEDHADVMREIAARGGRVLVHGLGLGMILRYALAQPNVEHVDVVELDRNVIDLVAHHYAGPRLTIHHGDAMQLEWPVEARWDVVWHDFWDTVQPANLVEMEYMLQRFEGRCDWQQCWSQDHALRIQRERAASAQP
jgi:hypothetical protein